MVLLFLLDLDLGHPILMLATFLIFIMIFIYLISIFLPLSPLFLPPSLPSSVMSRESSACNSSSVRGWPAPLGATCHHQRALSTGARGGRAALLSLLVPLSTNPSLTQPAPEATGGGPVLGIGGIRAWAPACRSHQCHGSKSGGLT